MSGLFGTTTIKGTRITDFGATSAEVGRAIPFGHGTFPVDGFILWADLPPKEQRHVQRQGKGGVKTETYTYSLSYAVGFLRGPIYGWRWIKRNGKVVYTTDPNAPIEDKDYAAKWATRVNFYNGAAGQLPDSLIESHEGVGNVSSFPFLAYFSVEDEDVTDNGGAPPNYEACVIASPPEAYLTSHPYPVNEIESTGLTLTPFSGRLRQLMFEAAAEPSLAEFALTPVTGYMRDIFVPATSGPSLADIGIAPVAGELKSQIKSADSQDSSASLSIAPQSGVLRQVLFTADSQDPSASITLVPQTGVLS